MNLQEKTYGELQRMCKDLKDQGLHDKPCNAKKEVLISLLDSLTAQKPKVNKIRINKFPKVDASSTSSSSSVTPQGVLSSSTSMSSAPSTTQSAALDFKSLKLGVMMHWGLYSVPGFHKYPKKPKILNGSEWYLRRLKSTFLYGYETQNYHYEHWAKRLGISSDPKENTANHHGYYLFKPIFEKAAESFNADHLLATVAQSGAKYFIMVVKHHDGFSLYPSTIRLKDMCTDRDYVKEVAAACERHGIHFGVYYSLYEIGNTIYKKGKPETYVTGVMIPQIQEIVNRYNPKIFWSDGDWEQTPEDWHSKEIVQWLQARNILVNDRWGIGTHGTAGDFRDVEDRWMPTTKPAFDWEHVIPIAKGWAYNRLHTDAEFMTPAQAKALQKRANGLGGNLLLGIGPDATGETDSREDLVLTHMAT